MKVTGTISNVQLTDMSMDTQKIKLFQPSNLDYEVIGMSERIDSESTISVLIRNSGAGPINIATKNWVYAATDSEGTCQGRISSRDCLLYSFIEMEFADFSNPRKNRVLTAVVNEFKESSTNEKEMIQHCPGGGPEVEACALPDYYSHGSYQKVMTDAQKLLDK